MDPSTPEQNRLWLEEKRPDVLVVQSMSRLLPKAMFDLPKLGAINLHLSFLPAYRGPNPLFWTYYNQEAEGGVTVHAIDEGEDTGPIYARERFPIPLGAPVGPLQRRIVAAIGVPLVQRTLDALAEETATGEPQSAESPTARARKLSPDDYGHLIDWERWPVRRAWHLLHGFDRQIRILGPPEGLRRYFYVYQVLDFEETDREPTPPGEIVDERGHIRIVARDGHIHLHRTGKYLNLLKHRLANSGGERT